MKKILIIIGLVICLSLAFVGSSYCADDGGDCGGAPYVSIIIRR